MDETDNELLHALVQGFDRAMLVSRCGSSMRSRPTTVANTRDSTRVWLLCGIIGDRLEELSVDPNVNVVMQDGVRFCSVTGTARVARPTGEETIWDEHQRAWLSQGERRSSLVLIEVKPQYAEFWDRAGLRGVRFDAGPGIRKTSPPPRPPLDASADAVRGKNDNVIIVEQARWKRLCAISKT